MGNRASTVSVRMRLRGTRAVEGEASAGGRAGGAEVVIECVLSLRGGVVFPTHPPCVCLRQSKKSLGDDNPNKINFPATVASPQSERYVSSK